MIYYLIVVLGVFACSASQLLLKQSATNNNRGLCGMMINWRVMLSYSIMIVVLLTNIFCMKHGVMLKDLPILEAMGYIFVPLLSMFFLGEKILKNNFIAILLILVGIFIFYL